MACTGIMRKSGGVTVVDLSGRMTLGEGCGVIRDTVKRLVESGEKLIVLNLAGVNYIDSAGLGELVGAYATVTNQGGALKLLNVQKYVHEVLQITRLYSVFEAFSDEKEALASFVKTARA